MINGFLDDIHGEIGKRKEEKENNIKRKKGDVGIGAKFASTTNSGPHRCDQNEYSTTKGSNLKKHVQERHEGISHQCEKCEYSSPDEQNLRRHIKIKHR